MSDRKALVILSGGQDSTTCLYWAIKNFGKKNVSAIGFDYGQRHKAELLCADEICKKEEFMVYLTNIQNQYESVYGTEIWNAEYEGVTFEENVKDTVLARIAQVKTMYLMAKAKGIELTEAELTQLETAAGEYYASLSDSEIELLGISKDTVYELYEEYAMAQKVYQWIIRDVNPEISNDEARIITVQHILIKTYYVTM